MALDYFTISSKLYKDASLQAIAKDMGVSKVFAVLLFINFLASGDYGYYLPYPDVRNLAAHLPDIPIKDIELIVVMLVAYGVFDRAMYNNERVLTNVGMQKRFLKVAARRDVDTKDLPYLLISPDLFVNSDEYTIPTLEEVKAYCREKRLYDVNPVIFYNYYESKGWAGKAKGSHIADWKAAARRWNKMGGLKNDW